MHRAALAIGLLIAATAAAQSPAAADAGAPTALPPAPSADEVKRVMRYYYEGKEAGPILVELKACTKIDTGKDSKTRNECLEAVTGPVKKNTNVHAWTLWMVPDGGEYEDVAIQYVFEGQVRSTIDIKLTTSFRSRTYRASTLSKAGKWEIKVVRGGKELGSVPVVVQ